MVYAFDISNTSVNPVAKFSSIELIMSVVVPMLMMGAALLFLVAMLYGAYTYLTAGSNPEKVKKAQKLFTYAIGGLILVFIAYIAVRVIAFVLNITNLPF